MKNHNYITLFLFIFLTVSTVTAQTIRKVEIVTPPGIANNSGTFEVAVVYSTGLVYNSGNAFGGEISVYDPNTNTIVANILPAPANGFNGGGSIFSRVNQSTNIVYFLTTPNSIDVIDGRPASPTFNRTLPAITFANQTIIAYAIDQMRSRLYVTTRTDVSGNPLQSQVHVVDVNPASATFHQTLSTVGLPSGQAVGHIAVNTVTNKIYVGTRQAPGGGVYVINGSTQAVSFIAGTMPTSAIAVNEVSNTVYAATTSLAPVQAIDGTTDTLITGISVPGISGINYGENIAVNSTTERVYLLLTNGTMSVIDAKRTSPTFNTVLANVANAGSVEVALDESTNKIVVVSNNIKTNVIDGNTNTIVATTIATSRSPDVAINPNTDRAFVAYQLSTQQVINLTDNSFVNVPLAGEVGEGIVNPNNNLFYFGRVRETTDIAFLDTADNLGMVSGEPHNIGRYLFAAQNVSTNRMYFVNVSANVAGTDSFPNFVSVVDGSTNSVVANVPVGAQPFADPAVNEATNKIYVFNAGFGTPFPAGITVINGATNTASTVNTSAITGTNFLGVSAVNAATNRIYFAAGAAAVINGTTDIATPLAIGSAFSVRVNSNLNRVYFLSSTGLRVLNGTNDSEIANITLSSPSNFVINQATGRIFVSSDANKTLTAIDGNSNTVVSTVSVSNTARAFTLAIDETRNRLYLGNVGDPNNETTSSISFIDGNSLEVRRILPIPLVPSRIKVNSATKTVYVTTSNAFQRSGIVVISDSASSLAPFDFDGDGKSDVSVFRPSNGVWYLQQSQAGFNGVAFGANDDLITPADYDGDGKTDIAVFRPSNGVWYLNRSQLGFTGIAFGASGDIPMPADYDGDGKADLAVFRPSNGVWYIQQSTTGFTGVAFGANGDIPVAADYDGDGKADVAVFRPSNGVWYLQRSQLGFTGVAFGAIGDKPVAADYDGDGKADLAVFRPSNGVWYLQQSTAGFVGISFGAGDDLPTPADYDGDGKTDIGVFRPPNGVWYQQRSTQGFTGIAFGAAGDKPAPSAFVP